MEPDDLEPSQETATETHFQLGEYSSYPSPYFHKMRFVFHLRLGPPNFLFPSCFLARILY
jgi:hypothetical protein